MLADYQKAFMEFALSVDLIKFGNFQIKSGRTSPWFFNTGQFNTGQVLRRVSQFYADAVNASGLSFDYLFGPSYKGIPLVSALAIAMAERYQKDLPYGFNRKEAKPHGEGGWLIGAEPKGKVLLVDDVITAGISVRDLMPFLEQTDSTPTALIISIDRQEKGPTEGELCASSELKRDFGMEVVSIVTMTDAIEYLEETGKYNKEVAAIRLYRETYGGK